MANFEKFTRGDYGLFAHCERKKDENGNYITLGNQRIDPARTHLNYNMCPNSGEQRERLEARLSDPNVKCLNRADVNVYGGWCVTLPTHVPVLDELGNIIYEQKTTKHKDGTITEDTVPKLREVQYTGEETKRFFELVYLFLTERYGEENVISAYVHMDETTPHMHFLFVPVIEDKKWNAKNPDKPPRVKVCAKELIDKIEMSVFHPELQKFLDTHSEKNLYPVLNGTTIGGNRTIAELKAQTALKEATDATRQAQAVKEAAERTISEVKEQEKQVQADIESIQEVRQETEADTEKWLEELEEKELPIVQGLRDDLKDMGIAPEGYDDIKIFAKALDNPIKSKTGKTYVEIPNPERTLPIIKKVINKVIAAIEKTRELTKKVKDQMGKARVSVRAMLKEAQEEARRQNAERKPNGKKKDISR